MEQIGETLSQFATKEVFTVLAALVAVWLGHKATTKTVSFVGNFFRKATFMGLASGTLLFAGLGAAGLGIGEVTSRPSGPEADVPLILDGSQLTAIATSEDVDASAVHDIVAYIQERDRLMVERQSQKGNAVTVMPVSHTPYTVSPAEQINPESMFSLPIAWMLIGLGMAGTISGITAFACRHSRRNPEDPHHPTSSRQYA